MKKKFSKKWVSSKQPRKQRKYRYNAPIHKRVKMMSSHLIPELREKYGKRSVLIVTGDEVKVTVGNHKNRSGKISKVDRKKLKVYISGIVSKKITGQESQIPISPSNVVITSVNLSDKTRESRIKRGMKDEKI